MPLYAAKGGNTASQLYTLDPDTGAATALGNTGYGITGLAFDPTTGVLYGSTSANSPIHFDGALITINPANGAATYIGQFADIDGDIGPLADICFDETGQLWGFTEDIDQLCQVDKATGSYTIPGDSGVASFGDGMDFHNGILYAALKGGTDDPPFSPYGMLFTLNTNTGLATPVDFFSGGPYTDGPAVSAMSFDPTGVCWAIENAFPQCSLVTIDINTRVITNVHTFADTKWDALAWDATPAGPTFTLALSPFSRNIGPGHSGSTTVTVTMFGGYADTVNLSLGSLPAGVTASLSDSTITPPGGTSTLHVSVGAGVASGIDFGVEVTAVGPDA